MVDGGTVGMIATGAMMVLMAPALFYNDWTQSNEWVKCVGRVVHISRTQEEGRIATVRYKNHKGEESTWRMAISDSGIIALGTDVKLVYNPQCPTEIAHDDKQSSLIRYLGMFALGLFFLSSGIYMASVEAAREDPGQVERDVPRLVEPSP